MSAFFANKRGDIMSVTVGAALKKIAVALFTNPKVLKTVGGVVIGIVLILALPIIAVCSFFNGDLNIDTTSLNQSIQTQFEAQHKEELEQINNTIEKIENKLKDKKLSKYNKQAEVIYLFYFSDKHSSDFIDKFVKCFKKDITDEALVKNINKEFNTEIKSDEIKKMMTSIKGSKIDISGFTDKTIKNNIDIVEWCKNAESNGWGYVWGGYGQICSIKYLDKMAKQYPGDTEAGGSMRTVGEKWIGKRVTDCIGLIKSYMWYNPKSGEITVGSNNFQDCSASSIWDNVKETGDISAIPEIPGLAVWMPGHIGVYIGDGYVVEAQGTAYGVVKTKLVGRGWSKWLKIPNMKYVTEVDKDEKTKDNKK